MWQAWLVGLALFMAITCCCLGCNTTKENKGMDTTFHWEAHAASPRFYPVEVKYASVAVGNTGYWTGASERFTGTGLGDFDGIVEADDEKIEIPSGIDVMWLSYLEKKFYRVKAKLPRYLQDRMLELFRDGYYDYPLKRYWTYDSFVITMLPKGRVWLYLSGIGRSTLVCDSLAGEEIQVSLKNFDKEGYAYHKTLDAFCKGRISDYPKAVENFKQNGIPEGLWDRYKRRYHYDIEFVYEDSRAVSGNDFLYRFITSEYYHRDKVQRFSTLPCARELQMGWHVGTTEYDAYFYFDEDEVMQKYAEAFGTSEKEGKLIVRVSKHNNKFAIYLQVDGKHYPFKKTKIHVFRETPEHQKEEDKPFYNNHEDINSEDIHYIGE